jgi:subfamily B ATP-binding cassette protein MsbA
MMSALYILSEVMKNYYTLRVSRRIVANIQLHLLEHIQMLPLLYLQTKDTGYLMSRFNDDAGMLNSIMTDTMLGSLEQIALLTIGTIAIFYLDWKLALISSLLLPLFAWNNVAYGQRVRERNAFLQEQKALMSRTIHEALAGVFVTKTCLRERLQLLQMCRQLKRTIRAEISAFIKVSRISSVVTFLGAMGPLVVLGYGGYSIICGRLTLGGLMAFSAVLGYLYGPCQSLAALYMSLQKGLVAVNRIGEILEVPCERGLQASSAGLIELPSNLKGEIRFDRVGFEYEAGRPVLHDISAIIGGGEAVAVVGESGAGKSSLVRLILRLHEPTVGAIYIDGHNIGKVDIRSLRRLVGIVPQEAFLFNTTILENIRYGRPGASNDDARRAAILANAHEFISTLPSGYLTDAGPQGFQLSAGQRQRIALARVILRNPRILILDEATSSVDSQSEELIWEALGRLMQNRTTLIVSHRLSSILHSDRILVLRNGTVAAYGPTDAIKQRGLCDDLYKGQFIGTDFKRLTEVDSSWSLMQKSSGA